jgi:predicted AAA+ superfamily ATPase
MDQTTYLQIVHHYLYTQQKHSVDDESNNKTIDVEVLGNALPDDIRAAALRWASERGGRSGRVAYQFSRYWSGKTQLAIEDSKR